ncbi:MAG: T9SS type A sorting domain-containing protein, partial [Bacteroidota bacterium]
NPAHTWQDSGRYEVQLVAVTDKGCTDTTIKNLRVIVPLVDVGVIDVRATIDGSYLLVEADIINAGTMPVENLALELSTSAGKLYREYLDHGFDAGAVEKYSFTTQPYIADGTLPEFVCVYLDPGTEDDVPENNEYCDLNEPDFTLFNLYPNPASDKLNITLLMPADGDINIQVFDGTGRLVFNKTHSLNAGYRMISLDCTGYSNGNYTLRISYEGNVDKRGFVVE